MAHQKFRLFSALSVVMLDCVVPLTGINDIPINLIKMFEIIEPACKYCNTMTV